ncbi:MAG: hypothetical protein ABW173_04340, partial [Sphingomonas sp.]
MDWTGCVIADCVGSDVAAVEGAGCVAGVAATAAGADGIGVPSATPVGTSARPTAAGCGCADGAGLGVV